MLIVLALACCGCVRTPVAADGAATPPGTPTPPTAQSLLAEMRHAVNQAGSYRATFDEHDHSATPGQQPNWSAGAARGWALVDLGHARRREHLTQWIDSISHGKGTLIPTPVDFKEVGSYAALYLPHKHRWLCVLPHYGGQYRSMDQYSIVWLLSLPKEVTREVVLGQVRLGSSLTWHVQVKEAEPVGFGIIEHDTIDGYIDVHTHLPVRQNVRGRQIVGTGRYTFRFWTDFADWGIPVPASLPRGCHA